MSERNLSDSDLIGDSIGEGDVVVRRVPEFESWEPPCVHYCTEEEIIHLSRAFCILDNKNIAWPKHKISDKEIIDSFKEVIKNRKLGQTTASAPRKIQRIKYIDGNYYGGAINMETMKVIRTKKKCFVEELDHDYLLLKELRRVFVRSMKRKGWRPFPEEGRNDEMLWYHKFTPRDIREIRKDEREEDRKRMQNCK
jgi:hypothetical protein